VPPRAAPTAKISFTSSETSTSPSPTGGLFEAEVLEERSGFCVLRLAGKGVERLVETEPGGHRYQRIPPTEKRGRVHTSTVTVSVLPEVERPELRLDMRDVRLDYYRATGAGGQHRNKTDSACRATHVPSGTVARAENSRSQHQNRERALAALATKLKETEAQAVSGARKQQRKAQVGSGMRGDKIRTTRLQDDQVTDHRADRKYRAKSYLRGDLDWLF